MIVTWAEEVSIVHRQCKRSRGSGVGHDQLEKWPWEKWRDSTAGLAGKEIEDWTREKGKGDWLPREGV